MYSRVPTPAKLIGSDEIVRLDRHDREEIDRRDVGSKGVGDAEERGKGPEVTDERHAEGRGGRPPVARIKVIGDADLDQLLAPGKPVRQVAHEIEPGDDKCARDKDH